MATNITFENTVRLAEKEARKEITVSKNVLTKFWGVEPFSGGVDTALLLGPIETEEILLESLGPSGSRTTNTNYGGRNEEYPDTSTNISPAQPIWRRRSSADSRQGRRVLVDIPRSEMQITGMDREKFIEMYKARMVDAYNYDMLQMMIAGFSQPMRENPNIAGYGGGGAKGYEVKFRDSYRHLVEGSFDMAMGSGVNKKGKYEAPLTVDGLDYIDSEMANCRDAGFFNPPGGSQEGVSLDRTGQSDTAVYSADNPRLGDVDAQATRVVVMGHTDFSVFKETNREILSRSEMFHDVKKFLGHAYMRQYGNYVFVSVPDVMVQTDQTFTFPDPTTWKFANNPVFSAVARGLHNVRGTKTVQIGGSNAFTMTANEPGPAGVGVRTVGGKSKTANILVRFTASGGTIFVRAPVADGGDPEDGELLDLFSVNSAIWNALGTGSKLIGAFRRFTGRLERATYPGAATLVAANNVSDFRTDTSKPATDAAQTYNAVASGNSVNFLVNLATGSAAAQRWASSDGLRLAYMVDKRAMRYGFPKEMDVRFKTAENFENSFETRMFSEYYVDAIRMYDPLVRQIFFTRTGAKVGDYKTV